jgi:hypothetical protein
LTFVLRRFADEKGYAPGGVDLSSCWIGLMDRDGESPEIKIDSFENNLPLESGQPFFS